MGYSPARPAGVGPSILCFHLEMEGGNYARALAGYEEAARLTPHDAEAHNDRAWLLATCPDARYRDGKRAVGSATRACELTNWRKSALLDTLAAAYAEAGDFARAARWQQETLDRTPEDDSDRKGFLHRLELYKAGNPYRAGPDGR